MYVYGGGEKLMYQGTCVEVRGRGQFTGVDPLFLPCGSLGLNSNHWNLQEETFLDVPSWNLQLPFVMMISS